MALLLVLVTLAVYWPATRCDFVNYDDPLYITDNPHVQAGLSWAGLKWAFGRVHGEGTYWHPLTWVSHMVDCQLYGLKPWGHHLTNVLLHAANAMLVFLVFRRMTGAFWRCAVLAALFALHPLQVDSVAWVAERKNLLSGFFWLLTTWAYVRYAEVHSPNSKVQRPKSDVQGPKPNVKGPMVSDPSPVFYITDHGIRITPHPTIFYVLSLFFLACGLMCKPVLVTLPFVLLLLDYWPLRRLQLLTSQPRLGLELKPPVSRLKVVLPLIWEKLPFFALAAASSAITILAHQALGMLDPALRPPSDLRVENALVSYVRYLGKTFWPSRLAVFYPYPTAWPSWEVVTCGLVLVVVSILVLSRVRSRPWLLLGWFWFLGVLVPFSGLIQVGPQAMADRFMYIPVIGMMVALTWGLHELAKGGRYQRFGLSVAAGAAVVLCLALTRHQLGYWKGGETLFRHALEVTENNADTRYNLGTALYQQGRFTEAIGQFQEAIRLNPDYTDAYNNFGLTLAEKGQTDAAISQYQKAIRLDPNRPQVHNNLGIALVREGQLEEAISQYQEAIRLKSDRAQVHNNLGIALGMKGQTDQAILELQEALRLDPDLANAHDNLGVAFDKKGQTDEAILQFQQALRLKPDNASARKNLNAILARKGDSSRPPGSPGSH